METIKEEVEFGGGELNASKIEIRESFSDSFPTTYRNSKATLRANTQKSLPSLGKKTTSKAKQRTIFKIKPVTTTTTLKVPDEDVTNIIRNQVLENKVRKLPTEEKLPICVEPSSISGAKSISASISSRAETGIEISRSGSLPSTAELTDEVIVTSPRTESSVNDLTQQRPSFYTHSQIPKRHNSSIRFSSAYPSRTAASLEACAAVKKKFLLMENNNNKDEAAPSNLSNSSAKKRVNVYCCLFLFYSVLFILV